MQEAERTLNYGCKLEGINEIKLYDMWLERDRTKTATKQTVRTQYQWTWGIQKGVKVHRNLC